MNFETTIVAIAEMVDNNAHSDAYVLGCKLLYDIKPAWVESVLNHMTSIKDQHYQLGYLSMSLSLERHDTYNDMMKLAKRMLNTQAYNKFYNSF